MYNVMDVARFIVNYSIEIGRPVSNLKLQKLLYFVQITFINQLGVPCFAESITHWRHGPVVENVYQKYKSYGSDNIVDRELNYFSFEFDVSSMTFNAVQNQYNENIFEFRDIIIIKSVIEKYKDMSPWAMVDLTHEEKPWQETNRNEEITIDMIKRFYS